LKYKRLLVGIGLGIAGGVLLKRKLSSQYVQPEKALKTVKPFFRSYGNVTGTWINSEPKWTSTSVHEGDIYEGGFTIDDNGEQKNYTFMLNAENGELITTHEI
jgi:predicted small secreted protein